MWLYLCTACCLIQGQGGKTRASWHHVARQEIACDIVSQWERIVTPPPHVTFNKIPNVGGEFIIIYIAFTVNLRWIYNVYRYINSFPHNSHLPDGLVWRWHTLCVLEMYSSNLDPDTSSLQWGLSLFSRVHNGTCISMSTFPSSPFINHPIIRRNITAVFGTDSASKTFLLPPSHKVFLQFLSLACVLLKGPKFLQLYFRIVQRQ